MLDQTVMREGVTYTRRGTPMFVVPASDLKPGDIGARIGFNDSQYTRLRGGLHYRAVVLTEFMRSTTHVHLEWDGGGTELMLSDPIEIWG